VTGWAVANWLLDCACLALSFVALGFGVPWKALLLAYGAGQLAVNLPITPGGLGVVEGSLTIALVIFGGAETQTVAAVLLYRIISFWGELPVGWAAWAGITWSNKATARRLAQDTAAAGVGGEATEQTARYEGEQTSRGQATGAKAGGQEGAQAWGAQASGAQASGAQRSGAQGSGAQGSGAQTTSAETRR
jgi:hypothetical protein